MALFIEVNLDSAVSQNAELRQKLVEVCPVDIFEADDSGLTIVDQNVDECTLCELCLEVGKPGQVQIKKLYDEGAVLQRS